LLGPVEVIGDGAAVALGGPKQRALLAELLLSRGAAVPRDRLVDALWGDSPPASALNSLQIYVHGLRRAVGAERLETRGTAYRVRVEPDELDVVRFERLLGQARQALAGGAAGEADELLEAALSLWRGDALADLGDSPVRAAASGLEELRRQALELRIDARLALGEHEEVIALLEELVAAEPYRERLREQLVLALYRAGRQQDALEAYQDARRRLSDELGVEPGPALRELERAILRHDPALAAGRPAAEPARRSLPVAATPLVGRRLEVAALEALFRRDGVRLVTLTGPGGTGKTRLALAAAGQLAESSRNGAAFVDLSSIREAELVDTAIAQALGLDDPHQVAPHLRDASLLLVLDNLEQIAADAAPQLARLLEHAPRLRILATSRVPLRLRGEQEYPVPPLPVAAPTRPFAELVASEAIALFAERAAAVDPEFMLDEATAPLVARICARLDGLPLAIELAAAQVRMLPPAALEQRLQRAVDVLVDGARDLPPRQRTLRATLDWSFELLAPRAQALLPRLAVFAGGFTLESLEAVAGEDATAALADLVEASLVRRRRERFHVLETIREYALTRLTEEAALRTAHAAHFRDLAEHAYAGILAGGERDRQGMAVLEREADNLRAAFAFAVETGDGETVVRLAEAQRWFWLVRGRNDEGRAAFDAAARADVGPLLHAKALNGSGTFAAKQGDTALAREHWQEALEIYREHGVDGEAARCLAELGSVAVAEGDLPEAHRLYETTAELFHGLGQHVREGIALSNLAAIAAMMDDLGSSVAYGERAIAVQREIEDLPDLAVSLASLAPTMFRLGDVGRGRELLREALKLGEEYDYTLLLAHTLAVAAELAALDGRPELAVRLVGATEGAFAAIGAEVPEGERQAFARTLELLGDLLPTDADALRRDGRALSIEEALDEARPLVA
jgi:predicted ATPase/DNA-binding SARP family transcriptional activator